LRDLQGRPRLLHRQRRAPSIQTDLHAGSGAVEWVVAGYALTSAIFLLPAGRLGDQFGRRRVFCISLAAFSLASAACGVAATPRIGTSGCQSSAAGVGRPALKSACCWLYLA
jgi:MFS family permease